MSDRLQLQVALAPDLPKFIRDGVDAALSELVERPWLFPEITGLAFAPAKTRVRRRRRSLLVALALTVAALVRRCDRRTLRVGDQREDGLCNGVPVSELCRATGLSPSRLRRALRLLVTAGYVVTHRQPVVAIPERSNLRRMRKGRRPLQRYAGLPAVRTLTPLLFRRLGFTARKVKKARDRGSLEWTRRRQPIASAVQLVDGRRMLQQLARGAARPSPAAGVASHYAAPAARSASLSEANDARDRRLQQLLLKPPPAR